MCVSWKPKRIWHTPVAQRTHDLEGKSGNGPAWFLWVKEEPDVMFSWVCHCLVHLNSATLFQPNLGFHSLIPASSGAALMVFLSTESLSLSSHCPLDLLFILQKSQFPWVHNCVFSFPVKLSYLLQTDCSWIVWPILSLGGSDFIFSATHGFLHELPEPPGCFLSTFQSVPSFSAPSGRYLDRESSRVP